MAFVVLHTPIKTERPNWYVYLCCHCKMEERTVITITRFVCLGLFLWTALIISWQSILALGFFVASVTLLQPRQKNDKEKVGHMSVEELIKSNPLKGKPNISTLAELSNEDIHDMDKKVATFCSFDAENSDSLERFLPIKENTQCIFAKKSRAWGSPPWNYEFSLEENIYRLIPTFLKFTTVCKKLGLDAFVCELPGELYGLDVTTFADAFRRTLKTISDYDPSNKHSMASKNIDKKGWVFEFDRVTFFITSFAPFYPETSPRYAFDVKNCYILFQPEISFAQHNIPIDTTQTNWDNPKTVRDKIRVAFKDAGRPYKIRESVYYPMCEDMVKPLNETDEIIKWWIPKEKIQ